ncbi:hypothetical protein BLA29_002414, partial [Euroglyphus maynei]
MSESQLPPVYMPKEHKRIRIDPLHARRQPYSLSSGGQTNRSSVGHRRSDDLFNIPKSLFDRSVGRHRREILLFKSKLWPGSQNLVSISNKAIANIDSMPIQNLSTALSRSQQNMPLINRMAEWTINEDYSIIYVLLFMQELPFNLSVIYPGHTPNWDFVADQVNALNCFKRSSKLCRYHFEIMMTDKDDQSTSGNMVNVSGAGLVSGVIGGGSVNDQMRSGTTMKQTKSSKKSAKQATLNQQQQQQQMIQQQQQIPSGIMPIMGNMPPPPIMVPGQLPNPISVQVNPSSSKQQTQQLNQQMLTAQLYRISNMMQKTITDNNLEFTNHMNRRFAAIKQIVIQRTQTSKSLFKKQQKKYDMTKIFKDNNIDFDRHLTVEEVAARRAE